MYRNYFKRLIDVAGSALALLVFSPVMILVCISLYIANAGKVFFTQVRPGKDGKPFRILKFKTMNDKRDSEGILLSDKERLTKIGAFVRGSSLDELPQLINVLKGDMSLIGPRPLLMQYLDIYTDEQKHRHDVRPGITGWAQVNGRNNITWTDKLEYDVWYVRNCSFALDLRIVWLTVKKIGNKGDISLDWKDTPWDGFNPNTHK
jgi:lipopolysaccharide/colanic/teichoic acid biosynthesis glycosyltransferase